MHPSSSPPSHSSSTPELHPVLQAALDSLDVELEEELSLYRRQRYCQAKHGKHIPAWQPAKGTGAKPGAIRSPQLPLMDLSRNLVTDQQLQDQLQDHQPSHWDEDADSVNRLVEDAFTEEISSNELRVTPQPFNSPAIPNAIASGTGNFSATNFTQANESVKTDAAASFNAGSLAIVAALQAQYPPHYAKIASSDKAFDRLRELALRPMSPDEWLNQEQENNDFKELTYPEVGAETGHPEAVYSETVYPENYPENIYPDSPQSGFFDSPDGYLESTEELLNSIAEEKPNYGAEQESSLLNSLLTPLGIGSMLLLLLSSATLGYVIMHPSSLDLFTSPEKSSANDADLDGKPASSDFSSPLIPDAPNLAADEFVDLNLGNLSTVPGSNTPRPLPARSPLANSQFDSDSASPSNLEANSQLIPSIAETQVAPQSSSLPAENSADFAPAVPAPVADPEPVDFADTESAPVSTSPSLPAIPTGTSEMPETVPDPDIVPSDVPVSNAPAAVATAPATPTAEGTYYVVTPYNGDPSLEQARQAVPEAYVRNFETGATVQLGVFNNAENAQELLQELQNQGIQAEVYQP